MYFPVFIFPCVLDDGHRRLRYIYHCKKYECSVSHLHTIALKNLIRCWVCVWFSSITLALQVMAVELRLCLVLPGIIETYCELCVHIKATTLRHAQVGGRIILCLHVALPMSVAKELYPLFHSWCLVTV